MKVLNMYGVYIRTRCFCESVRHRFVVNWLGLCHIRLDKPDLVVAR